MPVSLHSNRPNKKVGLRPPIRATRFRAKIEYIPPARQKQDTARNGSVLIWILALCCLVIGGGTADAKTLRIQDDAIRGSHNASLLEVVDITHPRHSFFPKGVLIFQKTIGIQNDFAIVQSVFLLGRKYTDSVNFICSLRCPRNPALGYVRQMERLAVIRRFLKIGFCHRDAAFSVNPSQIKGSIYHFYGRIAINLKLQNDAGHIGVVICKAPSLLWIPNIRYKNPRTFTGDYGGNAIFGGFRLPINNSESKDSDKYSADAHKAQNDIRQIFRCNQTREIALRGILGPVALCCGCLLLYYRDRIRGGRFWLWFFRILGMTLISAGWGALTLKMLALQNSEPFVSAFRRSLPPIIALYPGRMRKPKDD